MNITPSSMQTSSQIRRRDLVALAGAAVAGPALAQFRVEVTGVGLTQLPIAIAPFRGEADVPQKIASIVQADLERSGQFRAVDGGAPGLDETSHPDLSPWRQKGADSLAVGSITRLADGRFDVRYRLWDTVLGKELLGVRLVVPPAELRLAAHRIADAVYEKLTGIKGVFSTRIAYVTKGGGCYTLWVADADGDAAQSALGSHAPIISPAWSPDGQSLAYVSFEAGKAVVYTQHIATGQRKLVANYRGSNSAPAWSPDGRRLIVTLSKDGLSHLYVMSPDGENLQRLTHSDGIDTEGVWSPDGQWIYFVSDRGGSPQIYRMPAQGGDAQRVTFTGNYNISPSLSPDGRWLAYIARQSGNFKLQLMDLQNGTVTGLTNTLDDEHPSFAPNSRLIMYATRENGRSELMTTTLDGQIKARLNTPNAVVREPAWGPYAR